MQRYPQRDQPLRNDIYIIVALMAIYSLFHLAIPAPIGGLRPTLSTLLAGNAYILMAVSIFLSTRPRFLENTFGGLDKMYRAHRFCGTTSGLLVLAHYLVATKQLPAYLDPAQISLSPSKQLGMAAMIAFLILLALSLNRKIPYHRWRTPHKLMGLVFMLITAHFVTVADELFVRFGPAGLILLAAAALGIASYLANIFGLTRKNGYLFEVEAINTLERATEIILKPIGTRFAFTPGQFAFLEIQNKHLAEPHPFTIASAPGEAKLRFTIKANGDWSRAVRGKLTPGERVVVRGPHGRFDGHNAGNVQVWFAGGIGITPFLSMLRDIGPNDKRTIHIFYTVRELKDALFLTEIEQKVKALPKVTLTLLQSSKGQFADGDTIKQKIAAPLLNVDFFMCGPAPMVNGLKASLKRHAVPSMRLHAEAFDFR